MMRAGFLLLCLVAATYSQSSDNLKITDFAVPSSVKVGENAELQCRYELVGPESSMFYVKWWWTPQHDSDQRVQLYQRLKSQQPMLLYHGSVIIIKDNDTIELVNMQPKNSGVYECEVFNIAEERHRRHELVVYTPGSGPQLNMSLTADGPDEDLDEDVSIECEATAVAPYPELGLTVNDEHVNTTVVMTTHNDNSVFDIAVNATMSREELTGRLVRCELFFKDENIRHMPYVDTQTYRGSGGALPVTDTEAPLTTESSQTGGGHGLLSSWALLVLAAAAPARLLPLL